MKVDVCGRPLFANPVTYVLKDNKSLSRLPVWNHKHSKSCSKEKAPSRLLQVFEHKSDGCMFKAVQVQSWLISPSCINF